MAGVCCTPKENENWTDKKVIDGLRKMVQQFNILQIRKLISQIEDGLNNIYNATPQQTASGASSKSEISSSQFGHDLIEKYLMERVETRASKPCFLRRLKQETQKVVSDVLTGEDNMRWVAGGLSVVAYMMEQVKKTDAKGNEYDRLLLYMLGVLKHINQKIAWELTPEMLNDVVRFIVFESLLSIIRLKLGNLYWCGSPASVNAADMKNLEFQLGSTHKELAFGSIMMKVPTSKPQSQTRVMNEAGIEEAREVIRLLGVDSDDKSRRAIVIEGPDGIEKTTVVNAVFNRLQLRRYQVSRIVIDHNILEHDVKILQQQILRDLFRKDIVLRSCVEGRARLSKAFREEACRPVFIFIDNAHLDLAKLLPAEEQWLPIQSRILITTRDSSLCSIPAYIQTHHYSVTPLVDAEAKNLTDSLKITCAAIPVALTMVESYLRQHAHHVSADSCSIIIDFIYNRLDGPYKEAFLDIAIFFNNWERHLVTYIFSDIQLNVLEEKGLIMISREAKLGIHGVVKKWATTMSKKERITDVQSFKDALQDEEKLSQIKGIWLSEGVSELPIQAAKLDMMHASLRVLYLGKSTKVDGECSKKFQNLRFLYLNNQQCRPMSLSNFTRVAFFHGSFKKNDDFDELKKSMDDLQQSGISELTTVARELQLAKSLHVLYLSDSLDLVKLPEGFRCFSSLQELDLSKCVNLGDLPESLGQLKSLYRLNLRGCSKLTTLPKTLDKLSCLGELDCTECLKLSTLPDSFGQLNSLSHLQLRGCSQLISLPESFGNLSSLKYLDLSCCTQLRNLPKSFQNLSSLSHLRLACSKLTELPENFGNLSSLKELYFSESDKLERLENRFGQLQTLCSLHLEGCSKLTSLSEKFSQLSNLEELYLTGCDNLASLPANFGYFKCLRVLKLSCSRLTKLPTTIGFMLSLQRLTLTGCQNLARLPSAICELKSLSHLHLANCSELTELPLGFDKLSSLEELVLTDCRTLVSLPNDQQCPPSLRVLKLQGCSQFKRLHQNIGEPSLEELVLTGCESLESLPASFNETKSLRHLRLRGASKLTSFPDNLSSSIETLDLGGWSCLKMLPQGIGRYSSLKLLFMDGCSKLSGLPNNFGQLNSLTYLSIAGCTELETLPDHLENMSNLLAVNASECPRLEGETMDRLAELQYLYFVDVRGSPLLIEHWKQRSELHHQLVVLQRDEEAMYAETIISCLSQTAAIGTERITLVVTCSSDNQRLEVVKTKSNELQKEGFHICPINMTDTSKTGSEMKSRNLLCFAMLRLLKSRHPQTFSALEILHSWIVSVDVWTDKEGHQHIGKMKALLPAVEAEDRNDIDLEALTDILGGVSRFFLALLSTVADNIPRRAH